MKIICIGRNYAEHARELNHEVPDKPVFFMKPDSSLLLKNKPFFLPGFSNEIHFEAEVVLKICRLGKHIQPEFASRYYNEVGIGIDFTARDLQAECKKKGHPWEIAKAFDQSAVVNKFIPVSALANRNAIPFRLSVNGITVQEGNSSQMIFSFDTIISYISQFITLKNGDLIFTGTPAGVGPVKKGDHLIASLGEEEMLNFHIR